MMSKDQWEKRNKKVPLSTGYQTIPEQLVFLPMLSISKRAHLAILSSFSFVTSLDKLSKLNETLKKKMLNQWNKVQHKIKLRNIEGIA